LHNLVQGEFSFARAPDNAERNATMIYKAPANHPGLVCVMFELPSCLWADRICVSGTFNDWNERALPMHQDRDGIWRAQLELPLGQRYEFRYVIDGRWQTDYHADGFTDNDFGSHNSIVDLTLIMVLPMAERAGSHVPEEHAHTPPHLSALNNAALDTLRPVHNMTPVKMPRLRPRVAAA
jgi:hypothetical protein